MLSYCRNWWPGTTSIKKLPNKETITFLDRGNVNGHVSTRDVYECVEAAYFSTTKRISYWSGKVNQHTSDGIWQTDADGTSGANIDMLAYCRKYFPLTGSVVKSDRRETITFWTRGNDQPFSSLKDVYECVDGKVSNQTCVDTELVSITQFDGSSTISTGCDVVDSAELREWNGPDCVWSSGKTRIENKGPTNLYSTFHVKTHSGSLADSSEMDQEDYLMIEIRLCKAADSNDCSGWHQAVKMQDDVHGWDDTTVNTDMGTVTSDPNYVIDRPGEPAHGHNRQWSTFAESNGLWKATKVPLNAGDGFLEARVTLHEDNGREREASSPERHQLSKLKVWTSCDRSTPAPTGIPTPVPVCTRDSQICVDGSTVGRNAAKGCRFDDCPNPSETKVPTVDS
jgi:hypothetical protein